MYTLCLYGVEPAVFHCSDLWFCVAPSSNPSACVVPYQHITSNQVCQLGNRICDTPYCVILAPRWLFSRRVWSGFPVPFVSLQTIARRPGRNKFNSSFTLNNNITFTSCLILYHVALYIQFILLLAAGHAIHPPTQRSQRSLFSHLTRNPEGNNFKTNDNHKD